MLDDAASTKRARRFGSDWLVVKPPVSASAYGHATGSGPDDDLARRQSAAGAMMVQPLIEEIVAQRRIFADAVRRRIQPCGVKLPKAGDFRVQPNLGGIIDRCDPPAGCASSSPRPRSPRRPRATTYARVDIVVGNDGALQIMELELIEPALFLDHAPDGGAAFAQPSISCQRRANSHCRIAEVRFGGRSALEPRGVDLRNQRIDRTARARAPPLRALARTSARG